MNQFIFSTVQREILISVALQKFTSDKTEVFLNETQQIIGEWLTDYPASSGDNKKSREHIEKLTTQLDKTRGYLRSLPDVARNHLAAYWKYSEYKRKEWPSNINEIECFLLELQRCATDLVTPSGISKSVESDIVEKLAWAFVDTFRKKPTTSPDGPFVSYLKHLSENILTPQGNKIVFGKDLIASVLKHVKKRCDELDQFAKS